MSSVRRSSRFVALVLPVLVAAACSGGGATGPDGTATRAGTATTATTAPGADTAAPPTSVETAVPADAAPVLDGAPMARCAVSLEPAWCGTLAVPEDRSITGGRTIDLRVVVVPAADPAARAGTPLYALAGGPGGAATSDLGWVVTTFTGVHETSDIVLVDQRGTGASNPLVAPPPPDIAGATEEAARAAMGDWWDAAIASAGAAIAHYGTADAVDDLDAVRAALGHDRIDLFGASYGATAAQYYVERHGEHVRAVVLDGATLLDVAVFEQLAPNSQLALNALVARCDADVSCHTAFPAFGQEIDALLTELAARPAELPTTDATGEPVTIDAADLAAALHGALLDSSTAALLPALVHAAAAGEWASVAAAAGTPATGDGLLMSWVIRCSEPWARFDPANVERLGVGSYVAGVEVDLARAQQLLCAAAPEGALPDSDVTPAAAGAADVQVLLLNGSADPQDPPANVSAAATHFAHSASVVVPGQGHTVAHLGCVPTVVDAFLAAGSVDAIDTGCIDAGGAAPPPFATAP